LLEINASDQIQIGIIIPAYNAAETLPNTLAAVNHLKKMRQDISFYCVLIDDCSIDHTNVIANKFLATGTIDVYYRFEHNQGVSAARNKGISFCKETNYITFCDADDEFHVDGLKEMACQFNSDLIVFNHYRKSDATNLLVAYEFNRTLREERLSPLTLNAYLLQYMERPNKFSLWTACWAKFFRTDVIVKNAIEFDVQMNVFEDVKFNFQFLKYTESVKYIDASIYTHSLANSSTYSTSSTMGAHCSINERFAFTDALNTLSELLLQTTGNNCHKEINHCIGAYSIITLIRCCLTINSIHSFFVMRKQIILIFSTPTFTEAFHYYDAKKARGNRFIPWLIKNQFFSLAIALSYYLAKKRYS
jgi:glycosyltransferase involved in cell wall biosynthesis